MGDTKLKTNSLSKTITYDPAVYKPVPINPTQEMEVASHGTCNSPEGIAWLEENMHQEWALMLAAVPDQLPGLVEHSGEPAAWRVGKKGNLNCTVFEKDYADDLIREGYELIELLYRHPAPSQPRSQNDQIEIETLQHGIRQLNRRIAELEASQPSAEVLVQAALEAAAKECDEEQNAYSRQEDNQPPEFMVEASTGCYVCATRIRALSAQQITESCKEKS